MAEFTVNCYCFCLDVYIFVCLFRSIYHCVCLRKCSIQ